MQKTVHMKTFMNLRIDGQTETDLQMDG